MLTWGKNGDFKKTIYNSRLSDVPTFYTSPATTEFTSFAAMCDNDKEDKFVVFQSAVDEEVEEHTGLRNALRIC